MLAMDSAVSVVKPSKIKEDKHRSVVPNQRSWRARGTNPLPNKGDSPMKRKPLRKDTNHHEITDRTRMFNAAGDESLEPISLSSDPPPLPHDRSYRFGLMTARLNAGGRERMLVQRAQTFGIFVKAARDALQLTRQDLATRIDLTADFVFCLEQGMVELGEIEAAAGKIADALSIPSDMMVAQLKLVFAPTDDAHT